MLKRIRLKDFKSFVDEEVGVSTLTLLVGANASGKSNFLDAIRFLQGSALDLTIPEVLDGQERWPVRSWPGLRGGSSEVVRVGATSFCVESHWLAPDPYDWEGPTFRIDQKRIDVRYRIACSGSPYPKLEEAGLARGDGGDLLKIRMSDPGYLELIAKSDDPLKIAWKSGRLPQTIVESPIAKKHYDIEAYAISVYDALSAIRFIDMQPSAMRDFGRRNAPLGDEGKNFSGALADLCKDSVERQALVDWISEFCAPGVKDIEFIEVNELGVVMAMFVEKIGGRSLLVASQMVLLKFLGTLIALRTAEPGSVILIEDIDAGLHPTRIRLLVEYLEAVTRERQIQVIATTHSPVVLQWLSDESLRNAIVFGRVPDHEGTIMRRLGDLPHFNEVVERSGIDEMFTTGWLEMAL